MEICSPALIYLIFSITQLLFDISNKMYNTAFMKLIVVIMITILLHILCQRGQTTIAWLIVFIPFIFMSIVVGLLLYIFGLDPSTGSIKLPPNVSVDTSGNVVVYDPYYDPHKAPVYYSNPNIIVPKPATSPPEPYVPETKTVSSPNQDITITTIPTSNESATTPSNTTDTNTDTNTDNTTATTNTTTTTIIKA